MKVGDLVKYVGSARYYRDSVGIITELYSTHAIRKNNKVIPNSAVVYISDKPEGRSGPGLGQAGIPCFHPLALDEIEVVQ